MRLGFVAPLCLAALLAMATPAEARDTEYKLPIDEVLKNPAFDGKLDKDVTFFFAGQKTPPAAQSFGVHVTTKKTNSFGKPDVEACRWVMLSALIQLQERAKELGGDAVVDIVSYYKKHPFSSPDQYECHAGAFVAGVALKGTVVKLAR